MKRLKNTLVVGLAFALGIASLSASADSRVVEQEIARLASSIDGTVGVSAWRLDGRGTPVHLNADQRYPMASTFKIAVAAAILSKVDAGELQLDTMVAVAPEKYVDSLVIAEHFIHPGVSLSIHNLIEVMMTNSDNTATDVLVEQAGGPAAVTAWLRSQGIEDQRLDRDTRTLLKEFFGVDTSGLSKAEVVELVTANPELAKRGAGAYAPYDNDPRDTSTPPAMATLLQRIFTGQALSEASTRVLTSVMERCRTCDARLRGRMPAGTVVADKSGTVGGTVNDVGVVTLPDGSQFVIAAFVKASNAPRPDRERVIAEIARTVRDFYLFDSADAAR